jgi:hypothetical protein
LLRALYGLKQAPRACYSRIDSCLLAAGLTKSNADPNLYYSIVNEKYTIVLLYVDDLLVTGDNDMEIDRVTNHLTKTFEMTSLGAARLYLGVEIEYYRSGIWLHQRRYIKTLLQKFDMENCNPASTPMCTSMKLQADMNEPSADKDMYQSLIGGLIYATISRIDIALLLLLWVV